MSRAHRQTERRSRARSPAAALRRWLPTPLLRASVAAHAGAALLLVARPAAWRWAAGLAVADHLVLLAACLAPRSAALGPNLRRLDDGAAQRGEVALTFDDGPHPEVTPRVLDLLAAAGARASFFLVGARADRHPGLVAEIARRGHRVENHTWSHPHGFAFRGPAGLGSEIDRAQARLAELTGRVPAWFRAPAGIRNPVLAGVLAARGLGLASWTRRGFDAVSRDPRRVAARLVRGLAAGDVLLLHDGTGAGGGRPAPVLGALPPLLGALAARGLVSVPLPDAAGVPP